MAFLHTCHDTCVLSKQVITAFIVMVGIVDLGNLVAVVGHVPVHAIVEVAANLVVPVKCDFKTGITYGTGVLPLRREARGSWNLNLYEQILRLLVVPVHRSAQATIQEAGIDTEVGLLRSFPFKIIIGKTAQISTLSRILLGVSEGVVAVISIRECSQIAKGIANILITILTPAGTELQEVKPRSCGLHEFLVADHPTG